MPTEPVPGLLEFTRDEIPYDPNLPRLKYRVDDPSRRSELFVHHTVGADPDPTPNVWESIDEVLAKARQLQTVRPDLGLDVPYSFLGFMMADGSTVICEGRGWYYTGAHTAGHNTSGIGLGWVADFVNHPLPADVDDHLTRVGFWAPTAAPTGHNLSSSRVYGHKDAKPSTQCPGSIYGRLDVVRQSMEAIEMLSTEQTAALAAIPVETIEWLGQMGETSRTQFSASNTSFGWTLEGWRALSEAMATHFDARNGTPASARPSGSRPAEVIAELVLWLSATGDGDFSIDDVIVEINRRGIEGVVADD